MHPVATHVDEPTLHGIEAPVARLGNILVEKPGDREDHNQHKQQEDDAAQPGVRWRG